MGRKLAGLLKLAALIQINCLYFGLLEYLRWLRRIFTCFIIVDIFSGLFDPPQFTVFNRSPNVDLRWPADQHLLQKKKPYSKMISTNQPQWYEHLNIFKRFKAFFTTNRSKLKIKRKAFWWTPIDEQNNEHLNLTLTCERRVIPPKGPCHDGGQTGAQ